MQYFCQLSLGYGLDQGFYFLPCHKRCLRCHASISADLGFTSDAMIVTHLRSPSPCRITSADYCLSVDAMIGPSKFSSYPIIISSVIYQSSVTQSSLVHAGLEPLRSSVTNFLPTIQLDRPMAGRPEIEWVKVLLIQPYNIRIIFF